MKHVASLSLLLIVTNFFALTMAHNAGDVALRITLQYGKPKDGQRCTEKEKQSILRLVGGILQTQGNNADGHVDHDHTPSWCENLCYPLDGNFCIAMKKKCIIENGFDRRALVEDEAEDEGVHLSLAKRTSANSTLVTYVV